MYKVFANRVKCLGYLADTVFERAEYLGVEVLDLDVKLYPPGKPAVRPGLDRAGVLRKLRCDGVFSLALRLDEDAEPVEKVTVGIFETEVG